MTVPSPLKGLHLAVSDDVPRPASVDDMRARLIDLPRGLARPPVFTASAARPAPPPSREDAG
jgi:hypothetical protein